MQPIGPLFLGAAKRMVDARNRVPASEMPRLVMHGDTVRQTAETPSYQPQDGAGTSSLRVTDIAVRVPSGDGEAEDARLTGGTRSLMRRLSGLNIANVLSIPARSVSPKVVMGNAKVA